MSLVALAAQHVTGLHLVAAADPSGAQAGSPLKVSASVRARASVPSAFIV